jgi:two-component system CheB/CheR fusion protein
VVGIWSVIVCNKQGLILRTNEAMQKLTGFAKEKLLTENWNDYFSLEGENLAQERYEKLMLDGQYGPYQMTIMTNDQKSIYLQAQDYLSKDDGGHTQIWTFASDITKERIALHRLAENEARYRNTFEQANIGLAHVSLEGKWQKVNSSLSQTLGYGPDELLNYALKEVIYAADLKLNLSVLKGLIKGKKISDKIETRFTKKNGTVIWVSLSLTLMKDELQKLDYLLAVIEDITPIKLATEQSAQAQAVFNYTQEAIIITDDNLTVISVNPAFELISGYTKEQIIGKNTNELKSSKHTDEFYENMIRSITQTGAWSGEFIHETKSGEAFPTHIAINSVLDDKGKVIQYVGVITDISILVQSQARIKHLANHDVLTNLPNRNLFNEKLAHALAQARRAKNIVALFFIDIDKFKVINDGLGHEICDRVLITVAQRITSLLRAVDTVARVGGDEFMIIVEGLESAVDAGKIAQNIIDALAKEMTLGEHTVTVSASIGISMFPNDSIVAEELIHKADLAMYEAKADGRNTYCYTDKELSTTALERATLYNAIRNGLNKHEFEIYYQPIVDCKTMKVSHLEALIRWNHPELGLVLSGKFIPMAEGSELIIEISKFVIYDVFKTSYEMTKKNAKFPPIAINYSLKVLKSDAIFHLFKQYMKKYEGHNNPPTIELTEREFIISDEVNKQHLARYKELGIKFSMDDFGTGYSNLGYLIDNPFDTLKIDRTFVSKIGKDVKSDHVIKATISIANALRLKTVGECVETIEQLEFLSWV